MANKIRIKRRAAGGAAGAPASLENAELAYNEQDNVLYYGFGTGGAGGTATQCIPIAGPGFVAPLASPTFTGDPKAPTPATADNDTSIATTAFVKAQGYLTGNQGITLSGDVTGTGSTAIATTLKNTGTPGTYPKVTTDAQGRVTAGAALVAADIPTLTAAKISDFDTQVRLSRLDQMAAPTAALNMNNQRLISLADPTAATDAATKQYVDNVAQGLDTKQSVRAATTANITLSGTQTVDGVALVVGDRCLVKNQTTPAQNGIYIVASGAWARALDMDTWAEVPAAFCFVENGSTQADTSWTCTSDPGGTLGTTDILWAQFGAAASYSAGNGLQLGGNVFSIKHDGATLTSSAAGLKLSDTYAGQASIVTLGTVTTGVWGATAIAANKGGTGLTAYAVGDMLYASGAAALAALAAVAVGNVLLSNGVGAAPTWGKVALASAVSGTLPVGSGGTGVATLTGIVKGNGASAFSAAVDGTDYLSPNATIDGGVF